MRYFRHRNVKNNFYVFCFRILNLPIFLWWRRKYWYYKRWISVSCFFYGTNLSIFNSSTWGQKCIFLELEPFDLANFEFGHPVLCFFILEEQGTFLKRWIHIRISSLITVTWLNKTISRLENQIFTRFMLFSPYEIIIWSLKLRPIM